MVLTSYANYPNSILYSPNGQEFLSCKEVSSYMIAYFGAQDASHTRPSHDDDSIQDSCKVSSGDVSHCNESLLDYPSVFFSD